MVIFFDDDDDDRKGDICMELKNVGQHLREFDAQVPDARLQGKDVTPISSTSIRHIEVEYMQDKGSQSGHIPES
ncbi:hypothetical protein H5410_021519 [Solanum commersonii]|uniref:Uncharacterized protein n=1 Tax=Solanum commersonii TaxID=4109 RepID=A0A9J5ZHG1_SOLCO|nr:hypothetical protein H5410_021519 [Solanum commersonii]